ncbi:protein phosphatase 2c domain-containing protein, partial [Cystoisospora suis]
MISSAWEIVSSCCTRREWALRGLSDRGLGAEFRDANSALDSPVGRLLRVLPVLRSLSPPSPSLPIPASYPLSAVRDPLALFLYDPDCPPLVTALRFLFCCAAAGEWIRPAHALRHDEEATRNVYALLPSERSEEAPMFLCLCRDSVPFLQSVGSDASGGAATVGVGRMGEEEGQSQHGASGLHHKTIQNRIDRSSCAVGSSRLSSLSRSSSFVVGEDHTGACRLPSAYQDGRKLNGDNTSRTFEDNCFYALPEASFQDRPAKPALKRLQAAHFESSVSSSAPFFLPPCPVCGGIRLSEGAWTRLLFASADGGGLTSDDLEFMLQLSPSLIRRRSTSKSIHSQLSSSSSLSKSLRNSETLEQTEQETLLVFPVLERAAEEAAIDVEACIATSAASVPECFCVIGAFSNKLHATSFQVKEVLVLPVSGLSLGATRKASGLLGVTGDAFGIRNETVTTLENALATALSYGMSSPSTRVNAVSAQEREECVWPMRGLQRAITSMQRALDDLTEMMPHQFVNNEQAFICKAGQVSIGGVVAGVGFDAQKATDVVTTQILEDLLLRLGLAGKVFPDVEADAQGVNAQEASHGRRNEDGAKAKKQGPKDLQQVLLESLRQVASRLERPPTSYSRPATSSIAPGLFPRISFGFSTTSQKTSVVPPLLPPAGPGFNATSNGCAVCICVIHEETQTLLVSNIGDISAVLARPLIDTRGSATFSKQGMEVQLPRASPFFGMPLHGISPRHGRLRQTNLRELLNRNNTFRDVSISAHHRRTQGGPESGDMGRHGLSRRASSLLRKRLNARRVDSLSSSSGITSQARRKGTKRVTMQGQRRELGLDIHRDFVKMNFSFEAVVLTREHTLRESKERKRLMNAGIIPLGHISDDAEGQSNKGAFSVSSSAAYASPFSGAADGEAYFAAGFPHGEHVADDSLVFMNDRSSPAVDSKKNRDSRGAPKRRKDLSSQLSHHRLLLEDPPSLFLCPDTPCPPLRCTRLLGMTAAQLYGVYSTPDVACVNISKVSSPGFVLIASSAIWDLVHPQHAVDLVAEELHRQYAQQLQRVVLRYRQIKRQKQLFLRLAKRHLKKLKVNFDEEKHAWMKSRKEKYVSIQSTHQNQRETKNTEGSSPEIRPELPASREKEKSSCEWWGNAVTWVDVPPSSSSALTKQSTKERQKTVGTRREEERQDVDAAGDDGTWMRSIQSSFTRTTDEVEQEGREGREKQPSEVNNHFRWDEGSLKRDVSGNGNEGCRSPGRRKQSVIDAGLRVSEHAVPLASANLEMTAVSRDENSWSVNSSLSEEGFHEVSSLRTEQGKESKQGRNETGRGVSSSLSPCDEVTQPTGPWAANDNRSSLPDNRLQTRKLGFAVTESLSMDATPFEKSFALPRFFGLGTNSDNHEDSTDPLDANSDPQRHGSTCRSFSSSSKDLLAGQRLQSLSPLKVPRRFSGQGGLHLSPDPSSRFFKGITSLFRGLSKGSNRTRRFSSFLSLGQDRPERADTFGDATEGSEKPSSYKEHLQERASFTDEVVVGDKKDTVDDSGNNTNFLFERAKGISTYFTNFQFPSHSNSTDKVETDRPPPRHRFSSCSSGADHPSTAGDTTGKDEGDGHRRYYSDSRSETRRKTTGCASTTSWRTRTSVYPARLIDGRRMEDVSSSDQEKDGLLNNMLSRIHLSPEKNDGDVSDGRTATPVSRNKGIRKDPEKRRVSIHEKPESRFFHFESSFSARSDERHSFPPLKRAQTHISSLFCDSLFTEPPPYCKPRRTQRWNVEFDFQAASTLVLEQFMEEW